MEYLGDQVESTQGKILCCECGVPIDPNPSNMCVSCLRTQVDITEGIPKQCTLYFCKWCERYLQPPAQWVSCSLESRELLALCLKKLKGVNKVTLVDAGFVWTEPHSRRIKVKLTVQREVIGGAILQQVFIVEYQVSIQMCDDCRRTEAKDYWKAVVQVRQKTEHRRTFFYLEQLILKYKAHENTVGVKQNHEGLDFYFANEALARKLVDFLGTVVPCRYQHSKKLISHDVNSNTYNYKYTYSVEIVPVCKDSVVCLPKALAHQLGGISQICVIYRVTKNIHLIDPTTAQIAEVSSTLFWRYPFSSLCVSKNLSSYVIMNVELMDQADRGHTAGKGPMSYKHMPADVWLVKASELGMSSSTVHCRTHLGHLLHAGDVVLGFDMANSNVNDSHFDKIKEDDIPDVVLVKKSFADKAARNRRRLWKLKHLDADGIETGSANRDYVDFLEDLEEDPTLRQQVNIYRKKDIIPVDMDDAGDEDIPQITLEEMLVDLDIGEDATGDEGAAMAD